MKNKFSHLLAALAVGLIVSQSEAQQASFTYGIDRSTGNFIATDVWDNREYDEMLKDSVRKQDEQHGGLLNEPGGWRYRMSFILVRIDR